MNNYRPWGTLDWLLAKVSNVPWDLIGCIGTEDRSLEVYRRMASKLNSSKLLKIRDEDFPYSDDTKEILQQRLEEVKVIEGDENRSNVEDHDLLEVHDKMLSTIEEYITDKESVILDVSSMPKRFFFPILKILLEIFWYYQVVKLL